MKSRAGLVLLMLALVVVAGAAGAGAVFVLRDDGGGGGGGSPRTTEETVADAATCRAFAELSDAANAFFAAGATTGGWPAVQAALDPALTRIVSAHRAVRELVTGKALDAVDGLITYYTELRVVAAGATSLDEFQLRSAAIEGFDQLTSWQRAVLAQQPGSC
jgi:hypothetical protein